MRQMWQLIEPVHALVYYAPEVFEELAVGAVRDGGRWVLRRIRIENSWYQGDPALFFGRTDPRRPPR